MTRLALTIGINRYPSIPLSGCVNDSHLIAEILRGRGFDDVAMLLDEQATKEAIVGGMHRRLFDLKPGDLFVAWMSGHGSYQRDTSADEFDARDELWIPIDYRAAFRPLQLDRPDLGSPAGVIVDDELHQIFTAAHQRGVRVFVGSDSCFSGTVAKFVSTHPIGDDYRRARFLPPANFLDEGEQERTDRARSGPTRRIRRTRHRALLLSGCRDDQVSWCASFDGRPHGAMTYVAAASLDGLAADATYLQWWRAMRRGTPPNLPSVDFDQEPQLTGSDAMKKWRVLS